MAGGMTYWLAPSFSIRLANIMELRHIRYFLEVAAEKSISHAAEKLGIGQPSLSLQIRDLEHLVGARLFRRVARGVELTAAGEAFRELVHTMPIQAELAAAAAKRAADGELGLFRLGYTSSSIFNPAVSRSLGAFRAAYPDVKLALQESDTEELIAALRAGSLDAAFFRQGGMDGEGLRVRLLFEESLWAALPASHPAANAETVKLTALEEDPFLLFPRKDGSTLYDTIISACHDAGFEPRRIQTVPSMSSIVYLVAAGMGVSLAPESIRHVRMEGVVYRPVAGVTATVRLALAWRQGDRSPFLRNFIDQLDV